MTNPPISRYRAACELSDSIKNGYELVGECLEWMIRRHEELIRRLDERSISKEEFDSDMEEIRLMKQQVRAFTERLENSRKTVKKVFGEDEKK